MKTPQLQALNPNEKISTYPQFSIFAARPSRQPLLTASSAYHFEEMIQHTPAQGRYFSSSSSLFSSLSTSPHYHSLSIGVSCILHAIQIEKKLREDTTVLPVSMVPIPPSPSPSFPLPSFLLSVSSNKTY